MNQQDYIQAVEDMKTPASKALEWANIIVEKYYHLYNEPDTESHKYAREQFDRVLKACKKLVDKIQQIQEKIGSDQANSMNISEIFIHTLAGSIVEMRDGAKIILIYPYWRPETEQSEEEQEHIRYLKKINSAGEYLWSLNRDVVLKRMLDRLDE
jgi:hypothetical protein